jgi:hypothetical protein
VSELARRSWDKSGFVTGVGAISEGCGTMRWFGSMGMKSKGTCFRGERLLLVLEENFRAKQF